MIGIICDSANDISKDNVQRYAIKVAPIRIIIEGKEYRDGEEGCLEAVKEYIKDHVEALAIVYTGSMESTMNNVKRIKDAFEDKINTIYSNEINATLWTYTGIGLVGVAIMTE
ncbi:MAG: DegV family protein [Bacteroidota bacterium]